MEQQTQQQIETLHKTKVSVLIPFRDDGSRLRTFEWVQARWEANHPDWEIVVGSDDGTPFSKTTAVNDAFSRCTGDVLIVADADAWMDGDLSAAITAAVQERRLVVPWNRPHRLDGDSTAWIMQNLKPGESIPPEHKKKEVEGPPPQTAGTLFVISRESYLRVGGMDPRFRGYLLEDISFRLACDALLGRTIYGHLAVYCLWHPRPKTAEGKRSWDPESDSGQATAALAARYRNAVRKPSDMARLCNEHSLGAEIVAPRPPRKTLDQTGRPIVRRVTEPFDIRK